MRGDDRGVDQRAFGRLADRREVGLVVCQILAQETVLRSAGRRVPADAHACSGVGGPGHRRRGHVEDAPAGAVGGVDIPGACRIERAHRVPQRHTRRHRHILKARTLNVSNCRPAACAVDPAHETEVRRAGRFRPGDAHTALRRLKGRDVRSGDKGAGAARGVIGAADVAVRVKALHGVGVAMRGDDRGVDQRAFGRFADHGEVGLVVCQILAQEAVLRSAGRRVPADAHACSGVGGPGQRRRGHIEDTPAGAVSGVDIPGACRVERTHRVPQFHAQRRRRILIARTLNVSNCRPAACAVGPAHETEVRCAGGLRPGDAHAVLRRFQGRNVRLGDKGAGTARGIVGAAGAAVRVEALHGVSVTVRGDDRGVDQRAVGRLADRREVGLIQRQVLAQQTVLRRAVHRIPADTHACSGVGGPGQRRRGHIEDAPASAVGSVDIPGACRVERAHRVPQLHARGRRRILIARTLNVSNCRPGACSVGPAHETEVRCAGGLRPGDAHAVLRRLQGRNVRPGDKGAGTAGLVVQTRESILIDRLYCVGIAVG